MFWFYPAGIMKKNKSFLYSIMHQEKVNKKEYLKLTRSIMIFVATILIISFIVFIGISFFSKGGILQVINYIYNSNLYIYSLAFLFEFLSIFIRFFKWKYFLRILGIKISKIKNFIIYLSLYSMNLTPGKIGRVASAYTLNRVSKIRFVSILPVVSMDIFTDFLGLIIISIIIGFFFINYLPLIIGIDILLLLPFIFILNPWLFRILKNLLKGRFADVFTLYGDEYFASQSKLNNTKTYTVSIFFTIPSAIFTSLSLYFSLLALHVNADILNSMFVYLISILIGILSFIPGTIGSADIAMTTFISGTFSVSSTIAAAATIMTRIATLWFGVIIGSIFLFYAFKYWK